MSLIGDEEFNQLAQKYKFLRRAYSAPEGATIGHPGASIAQPTFSYVVVDIETTGLQPETHEILEIAAIRMNDQGEKEIFETLIEPTGPVPPFIQDMTGIKPEMLKGKPRAAQVLKDFLQFASGSAIVAHNTDFDVQFLQKKCALELQPRMESPVICTLRLARYLYPTLGNHKLHTVAANLDIRTPHRHRALGDAEITLQIFQKMLPDLSRRGFENQSKIAALTEELGAREPAPF